MCDCDCDPPKVFNHDTRKSRKERRCDECRRTIRKGETYDALSGLWEGGWMTFAHCEHCSLACEVIQSRATDLCFCLGEMWAGIEEETDRRDSPEVNRLIVWARRKWTVRHGARKGLRVPLDAVRALSGGSVLQPQ